MNAALIFAGGTGVRMNSKTRPKQFLKFHDKEIIIHTVEHFEDHPNIDVIVIVCISTWIDYLKEVLHKYRIKKVKWVVEGGRSGQESIYNGLKKLRENCPKDTVVLIHDGVRPLIDEKLISDNIECTLKNGSAITVTPVVETVITFDQSEKINHILDRERCMVAKAPQSFLLRDILKAHEQARKEGKNYFIDSASMMFHYEFPLTTVNGNYENIKITTPSDFYILRALAESKENSQIFGL